MTFGAATRHKQYCVAHIAFGETQICLRYLRETQNAGRRMAYQADYSLGCNVAAACKSLCRMDLRNASVWVAGGAEHAF